MRTDLKYIGEVENFPVLKAIVDAIHSRVSNFSIPGQSGIHPVKRMAGGKLAAVNMGPLLYIEQNPDTGSKSAARARDGAKIIWVIDGRRPHSEQYRGGVEDGKVYMKDLPEEKQPDVETLYVHKHVSVGLDRAAGELDEEASVSEEGEADFTDLRPGWGVDLPENSGRSPTPSVRAGTGGVVGSDIPGGFGGTADRGLGSDVKGEGLIDGGHIRFECKPGPNGEPPHHESFTHCQFCDGGLFACTVCHGFEGSLPTNCPMEPLEDGDDERIHKGLLDFRNGSWVVRPYESYENQDLRKEAEATAAVHRLNRGLKCAFCKLPESQCTGEETGHPFILMDLSD